MNRLSKVASIAAAAGAVVVLLPGTSQAAPAFQLYNRNGGAKCLEIENSSVSNGARAQSWGCRGQAGAYWYMRTKSDGTFELVNRNSGKCLEIENSSKSNGARAQQWECVGNDTQRWYWGRSSSLVNANSGKCLEFADSSWSNGARAQQWEYAYIDGQSWNQIA
ncbi:RICIN domain-containing protein [Streptomyces eurocidicus]|uniref:Ricin B lectin domain-containing protein n=1 Tax=Streptomyces eurocidicus TaxID=66423 RepID=A0A7W8BA41_STREU|nr:RICIN domain-containing protein [Streptomyces eurocidicus]MBB5118033.1 hypothetical protein [Streptomyces eurocidicus]